MVITQDNLKTLIQSLIKNNQTVIGPVNEGNTSNYKSITSFDEINLALSYPTKSTKEYFFTDSEPILTYAFSEKNKPTIEEPSEPKSLILFGVRPCEAISYPIMDNVFSWGYRDEFYLKRREKNIIISVACENCDEFCFCTSVGISPQTTEGSDIFLQKTEKGNYLIQFITDKGKNLLASYKTLIESSDEKPIDYKGPEKKFDISVIKPWLEKNFEHPIWNKIVLPCIGCGACTYLCPTCHCFDIIDEGTLKGGCRYKNWDACQFAMFTIHASGHNPRDTQSKRFRQRIQHKFNYYADKFGKTLCVGCGRCIRHCPADMSLLNVLTTIDRLVKK
ncbi:MAG: 4Fe-4S dicluster domain-containing protein [Planctomycetota bacterium]